MSREEQWATHYTGLRVSDAGNVIRNGKRITFSDDNNYRTVGYKSKQWAVHVLVLETFIGPADGHCACHKNDEKADNRLVNLYWGTRADNTRDMWRNKKRRGEWAPKPPESARTVKFSFTMTPAEAKPVLKALAKVHNKSDWFRAAVLAKAARKAAK